MEIIFQFNYFTHVVHLDNPYLLFDIKAKAASANWANMAHIQQSKNQTEV